MDRRVYWMGRGIESLSRHELEEAFIKLFKIYHDLMTPDEISARAERKAAAKIAEWRRPSA